MATFLSLDTCDQSEKLQQAIDLLSSLTRSGTRSASSEPGTSRAGGDDEVSNGERQVVTGKLLGYLVLPGNKINNKY